MVRECPPFGTAPSSLSAAERLDSFDAVHSEPLSLSVSESQLDAEHEHELDAAVSPAVSLCDGRALWAFSKHRE